MRPTPTPTDPDGASNPYAAPDAEVVPGRTPVVAGGGASWRIFLGILVAAGMPFWLFWSFWMSIFLRRDLVSILLGPGAGCGLSFGVFFGGFMAIVMRPAAVTFPVGDGDDFVSRLDGELAKLRYRPLGRAEGLWTYGPRTLFRPHAFDITVRVGAGEATVAGPRANVKALFKRFQREPS